MTRSFQLPRLASALAAAALGLTLGLVALPDDAQAAIPKQLQPGQRPYFFQFGFGIAQAFAGSHGRINPDPNDPLFRGRGWWGWYNTVKFHQELGFHLNGTPKGPSLGFFIQEELGHSYRGYNYYDPKKGVYYGGSLPFGIVVAPRFQWDIQIVKNLGLYLAPNFSLGYHGITCGAGCGFAHYADIQAGMNVRLVVNDRFIGWIILPEFNMMIGTNAEIIARYELMTGVGVAF